TLGFSCLNAHSPIGLPTTRSRNARLGVEAITRSEPIARSATNCRSSSSTGHCHAASPDRRFLEKASRGSNGAHLNQPETLYHCWPKDGAQVIDAPRILMTIGAAAITTRPNEPRAAQRLATRSGSWRSVACDEEHGANTQASAPIRRSTPRLQRRCTEPG